MTTIILTIIGILLAAVAALMVIFYGGSAFNSGSIGAQANTLQNAGTNVLSAVQLFNADGENAGATPTLASLTPAYLKTAPSLPGGLTGAFDTTTTYYEVSGVSTSVCDRVNSNLKNQAAGVQTTSATEVEGDHKMGCAGGTFYATL